MDRRHFLRVTALAGLGVAVGGREAAALKQIDCSDDGANYACKRIAEHEGFLRDMDQMLAEKGVNDPAERQALLAAATCPVCGLPLMPSATGGF
ncbi:hypothetical protein [Magnetospirillum molischianum]|uniref:Uncharacterized protein n=1 Tax=Magnetospirillum molischianum DSM 120 TaxID=1150626 RepID=H8FMK5_MAGML|nr:hypothetical protein [Magnetospirillum molischianum]CCG39593.1 exported hypothetical protein [Magnetospirillum molischianum DSM 120]